MYRLLVLDLDGTLTDSKTEIPERNLNTLLRAQEKGLRIVLASGRPTYGITPLAKQLQLDRFGGYILSFNGGQIIDCKTSKVIYETVLDPVHYDYLYEMGNTEHFKIVSYEDDYIVCEDTENEYIRYEAFLNKMPLKEVKDFRAHFNYPLPKCLVVGEPSKLVKLEETMRTHLEGHMSVYRSEPFFLELLPLGIDKAKSLAVLLERIGYTHEEMIACGDGFNDLSMIQYAGLGVAMANAQDVVKEAADHITGSNEDCGVAQVVEEFFLNRIS